VWGAGFIAPVVNYVWPAQTRGPATESVSLGKADDFAEGDAKMAALNGSPVIVLRTPQGFKAFSAICTHLGCIVSWDAARHQIACPCHAGFFDLTIPPSHDRIILTHRLDYSIWNQTAKVYIDGAEAGSFENMSFDPTYRWRDASIAIPAQLTQGKFTVHIKVADMGSPLGLTEYGYWVEAVTGESVQRSDILTVGSQESEKQHGYVTSEVSQIVARAGVYPPAPQAADTALSSLWVRMAWDGRDQPSVEAPIGMFFGIGCYGLQSRPQTLMLGMRDDNTLYCYFPMPFAASARIELVNKGSEAFTVQGSVSVAAPMDTPYGLFTAQYKSQHGAADDDRDMLLLDAYGSGSLVSVLYCPRSEDLARAYFEGDERIYEDGNLTPAMHGTGMEDFFNGGWGYKYNLFTQPTHAFSAHRKDGLLDQTSQLRLFLSDKVTFRTGIRVSIEHGNRNHIETDMDALSLFYLCDDPVMERTDFLDVGDSQSEAAHGYWVTNIDWQGMRGYTYEGEADMETITDTGCRHHGVSEFTVALNQDNAGILLRRRLDQKYANQKAEVYVDSELVGIWYDAGSNLYHQWKDSDFEIPKRFTQGKEKILISVRFVSAVQNQWSEFSYTTFSILPYKMD
jgi:hypothetical protein